jgi:hypothetical protein
MAVARWAGGKPPVTVPSGDFQLRVTVFCEGKLKDEFEDL